MKSTLPDAVSGRAERILPAWLSGVLFALALLLQTAAIHHQSLGGDGAYHLLTGHQALRYGQNTLNLEHPPLVKMVGSVPLLLFDPAIAPPTTVDQALVSSEALFLQSETLIWATRAGRSLIFVFFVLPLLAAVYSFGKRWGNPAAAEILLLLVALAFSVLPSLSTLQTDSAISLAFILVLLLADRYRVQPSAKQAVLLGLGLGLGLSVKFSGLLLAPTVLLAWALPTITRRRILVPIGHLLFLSLTAYLTVDLVYSAANWNYDAELGRETISTYCEGRGTLVVEDRLLPLEEVLLEIESRQSRFAQWLVGFLGIRAQNQIGVYPSFAFGEIRYDGRAWYFPVLFLVKTSLVILFVLLLALPGIGRSARDKAAWQRNILPLSLLLVYGLTALTSKYNLGVRHLMPIMPILFLPAATYLSKRKHLARACVLLLALEALWLAPLWMSQTNTWFLGSSNPTRFSLGAGNLEYRQNFIELAREVEERGIENLRVLYPPLASSAISAYLPDASILQPGEQVEGGWYAVNVRVEQYIPAIETSDVPEALRQLGATWKPVWESIRQGEDHGYVAGTFHLYYLQETP